MTVFELAKLHPFDLITEYRSACRSARGGVLNLKRVGLVSAEQKIAAILNARDHAKPRAGAGETAAGRIGPPAPVRSS